MEQQVARRVDNKNRQNFNAKSGFISSTGILTHALWAPKRREWNEKIDEEVRQALAIPPI